MKYLSFLVLIVSFVLVGCSYNNDEPKYNEDKLIGYWAITHIQIIENLGDVHSTNDEDVPPHGIDADAYAGDENYRYDVLIFDENFVTVRGRLPNIPQTKDYELDTTEGQEQYFDDYDKWCDAIGSATDQFACPVGKYKIKNGELIIGSSNVGFIRFISDNEFTLDYTKLLRSPNDYRRLIYTYTRIYSLTL